MVVFFSNYRVLNEGGGGRGREGGREREGEGGR